MTNSTLLDKYPKIRPILPEEYIKIYADHYIYCRSNKGFVRKIFTFFTNWMHLKIKRYNNQKKLLLELGAGTLNHVGFENVFEYDVIEPFDDLFESASENLKAKVNKRYKYSTDIKVHKKYDRIISIATLEHLTNLPFDIAILTKVLKKNGKFQHSYPSEGSYLWYFCSRYISGLNFFLKHKLNFNVFLKHEHVNSAKEIEELFNLIFEKVKIKRFPFNFFHLSLFSYIEASNPKIEMPDKIIKKFSKYNYESIF